jgi:hypothetical protein
VATEDALVILDVLVDPRRVLSIKRARIFDFALLEQVDQIAAQLAETARAGQGWIARLRVRDLPGLLELVRRHLEEVV